MARIYDEGASDIVLHPFRISDLIKGDIGSGLQKLLSNPTLSSNTRLLNRAHCSIVTKEVLTLVLSWHLDVDGCSIDLHRDDFGKVIMKNSDFHFNISHTDDWIYIAVSRQKIGVDIEFHRRMRSQKVFANYFKSLSRSNDYVEDDFDTNGPIKVWQHWCRAEAVAKCIGIGMIESLEVFNLPQNLSSDVVRVDTKYGAVWICEIPSAVNFCAYVAHTHPFKSLEVICSNSIQNSLSESRIAKNMSVAFSKEPLDLLDRLKISEQQNGKYKKCNQLRTSDAMDYRSLNFGMN